MTDRASEGVPGTPSLALLVVLNGPPASGKTTQARLLAAALAHGCAAIDIDELRSMQDTWPDDPIAAGLSARKESLEVVAEHLDAGRSIVISQLYGVGADLDDLAQVAPRAGARYVELVLDVPYVVALEWFKDRGGEQLDSLAHNGSVEEGFEHLFDRVMEGTAHRPQAQRVPVAIGDPHLTLERILEAL